MPHTHSKPLLRTTLCLLACCAWSVGCQAILDPSNEALESLLRPIEATPDSVTIEIFQVRIPTELARQSQQLWERVDEQQLDADVRKQLADNGLRAGTIVAPLPDELEEILSLTEQRNEPSVEQVIDNLAARPRVTRRVVQINPEEQTPITVSQVREHLNVLINDPDGLHGHEYHQVESVYTVKAQPQVGQRARLTLIPELHHGELRNRRIGSDRGIFLMTPSRERDAFSAMQIQTDLEAGEMLILGGLPNAGSTLGHAFHTVETAGAKEQKLILIRLLQVPASEILAEN